MAPLRRKRPRAICGRCGKRCVHLSKHINDMHTRERMYQCGINGCKYKATQRCNLLGHQRRNHQLSLDIGDTIAPLPSDTFFPHPTVTSSSSIAYSGPGDGVIPVNYPAQYGGAAFAASSVDMGPSFGPHFPVAIAGASFLASQPIPRPLVESSNLSSLCRVASMGKGFTYLGPPPPRPPHPLRFLFDEVRVYAPVMQRNLLTINSGCPIIPGEVAAPATNDSPEPHNPHLNIDTALVLDIEAELRQIFGNFEDTGKVMWSGAGGA